MHDDTPPSGDHEPPSSLPRRVEFVEAFPGRGGAGPQLSLEQVLATSAVDFRGALGLSEDDGLDFEGLSDAVEEAQSALIAHLTPPRNGDDPVAKEREGGDGLDAAELTSLIQVHEQAGGSTDLARSAAEPFHESSILLHLVHRVPEMSAESAGRAIDAALGEVEATPAYYFIVRAVHDMANHASHEEFDRWMKAAMPTLRRCAMPLFDCLTELAVASAPHGRAALWPYAVDEMLVTLKGRKEGIDPQIHELSSDAMAAAVERLAGFNAIARQRLASGMLDMGQSFVHTILADLMKTSGRSLVGPILFDKFSEFAAADRGVSLCMFALRQYRPEVGALLAEQLRDLKSPVDEKVQAEAAWLLVGTLGSLPSERRGETWIPGALDWLGEREALHDSEAQKQAVALLLRRVQSERSGLKRSWNRECRQAAKGALGGGN